MKNFKYLRLAEEIKELLTIIINEELEYDFITITHVELTKDLGDAKIYINSLNDDDQKVLNLLNKKSNFLKSCIAKNIKIRKVPNLIFKIDKSLDNYNKIVNILEEKSDQ